MKGKKSSGGLKLAGPAALLMAAFLTISSSAPGKEVSPPPETEIIRTSPLPTEETAPPSPSIPPEKNQYTVYLDYNLGDFIVLKKRPEADSSSDSLSLSMTVEKGTVLSGDYSLEAEDCVTASGYFGDETSPVIFTGWYRQDGSPFDFSESINEDLSLCAGWHLEVYECCFKNRPLGGGLDSEGNAHVSLKTTVSPVVFGKAVSLDSLLRDDEEYFGQRNENVCRMSFIFSYTDETGNTVIHRLGNDDALAVDNVSLNGESAELTWSAVLGSELLKASENGSNHKLYARGAVCIDGIEYLLSETNTASYPVEFFDPEGSERIIQNGVSVLMMDGKVLLIDMSDCPDAGILVMDNDNSRFTGRVSYDVFYPADVGTEEISDIWILRKGAPQPGFFDTLEDSPDLIAHFQIS
ncbi:MAG: hypothetical protein MJ067_00280 [Oscillospiraceae bacterium]|nr:hypothetical protein [Oscillospiraceae bacterium]